MTQSSRCYRISYVYDIVYDIVGYQEIQMLGRSETGPGPGLFSESAAAGAAGPGPRARPRRPVTQRARGEIFKLAVRARRGPPPTQWQAQAEPVTGRPRRPRRLSSTPGSQAQASHVVTETERQIGIYTL